MYDKILLPTDGSDGSTAAATHAGSLAEQYGATVHVLSVVDSRNRFESPSSGLAPDVWTEEERKRSTDAVTTAREHLPESIDVETHIETGVPRKAILAAIDDLEPDLVVMGTHGRTGLERYLIGSVAERIVRASPVPVMTVRIED
jgi:nucleotide-binding universal stress UspA family protein